ncbi:MAG: S41 family peptidase [Pseudomonadota bacterium]
MAGALSLGACSAGGAPVPGGSETSARVFAIGLADVQRVYIDPIEVDDLAIAGVEGLSEIDPNITIERRGKAVQLAVRGKPTGSYDAPDDHDTVGWGRLTDSMVRDLTEVSPALASADSERIYESVFDAVADSLDRYSRYSSRSEALESRANRDGFGGVGIRIDIVPEGVAVQKVMQGTPAERAGLADGDVIVAIDGVSAAGIDQKAAVKRLRGPIDSKVNLTLQRGDSDTLEATVTRAFVVPQTVSWTQEDGILNLRVEGFNHDTTRAIRAAVRKAENEGGGPPRGAILDLRSNPGGLLDQAVMVSDLFLDEGTIVTTHGRHPESRQAFDAQDFHLLDAVPLVVLINGYSASASEIVAAALQDNGRALVVGSVSYGKGSVQNLLRLPNEGELTLTWARFHAPSGYPLSGRGVMPNLCTSGYASTREVITSADRRSNRAFQLQRVISPHDQPALDSFRTNCPSVDTENALETEVARTLLRDPALYRRILNRDQPSQTVQARGGSWLQ